MMRPAPPDSGDARGTPGLAMMMLSNDDGEKMSHTNLAKKPQKSLNVFRELERSAKISAY